MTLMLKFTEKIPSDNLRTTMIYAGAIVYLRSKNKFYRVLHRPNHQIAPGVPHTIHTCLFPIREVDDSVIVGKLAVHERLFINLEVCGVVKVFEE